MDEADDSWYDLAAEVDRADANHDPLARAVGHVAMASADLEDTLRSLLRSFLLGDSAWLIGQGESSDWLINNCLLIASESHQVSTARSNRHAHLVEVLKRCRKAFLRRNTVVHATWFFLPDGGYIASQSKRFNEPRGVAFGLTDLEEMASEFDRLGRAVWAARD